MLIIMYCTIQLSKYIPADFSKVAKVYTVPTVDDWTKYEDNKKLIMGTLISRMLQDMY